MSSVHSIISHILCLKKLPADDFCVTVNLRGYCRLRKKKSILCKPLILRAVLYNNSHIYNVVSDMPQINACSDMAIPSLHIIAAPWNMYKQIPNSTVYVHYSEFANGMPGWYSPERMWLNPLCAKYYNSKTFKVINTSMTHDDRIFHMISLFPCPSHGDGAFVVQDSRCIAIAIYFDKHPSCYEIYDSAL